MNNPLIAEFPVFPAAPAISPLTYLSRLSRLWEQMADDSVMILVSNPEAKRSKDTNFSFRQSSDIVYLCGFPEPNCALIVSKLSGKQEILLLVQPKDKERELWDGRRLGLQGARKSYFASKAYAVSEFETLLAGLLKKAKQVYYRFGLNHEFDASFQKHWCEEAQVSLLNFEPILAEMRLIKGAEELRLMKHSALVSAEAHKQAMLAARPGMYEYQIQALLEFVFKSAGAVAPAYGSIVASGENACTLHYVENSKALSDGDLLLIDAGAEFGGISGGYAADITRCFPVNGKFSPAQKEVYELVLAAQLAAIEKARPGVRLIELHRAAQKVLRRGLTQMGILPERKVGKAKKAGSAGKELTLSQLMPHGTSHWLGIDVHDVGSYQDKADSARLASLPKRRILEPGMVITVEPGLYFGKHDRRIPARYRGIGVRIEDDLFISQTGAEVLTDAVPKTVDEIESLMQR